MKMKLGKYILSYMYVYWVTQDTKTGFPPPRETG